MLLTKKVFKTTFIEALKENGLSVYFNKNNYYILIKDNDSSRIEAVELICSTQINPEIHGSHNGNILSGIGRFKFAIPKLVDKINFYVFALLNTVEKNIEFVIVPNEVLRSRFQNQNRIPASTKKAELMLWLMDDRCAFDVTQISSSGESEWYMLSKGVGGRMADGTDMDHTEFLNNWDRLID